MAKNISASDIFGGMFGNVMRQAPEVSAASENECKDHPALAVRREELHAFRGHPFRVVEDEKMLDLAESIRTYGICEPLLIRPDPVEGGFEIVSGHRRNYAAGLAGLEEVPVRIREMDDDLATILMVDSNNKREVLLPSEKAWSYRMKAEALRHQGKRNDLVPETEKPGYSAEMIGKDFRESARTIQRYIRLTYLIQELLTLVDEGKLSFGIGYQFSFFTESEQNLVWIYCRDHHVIPDAAQAQKLTGYQKEGILTVQTLENVFMEKTAVNRSITLKEDRIKAYFPKDATKEYMEEVIVNLLQKWAGQEE